MDIDEIFYNNQTAIRGCLSEESIVALCEAEYLRIKPILSATLDRVKVTESVKALDVPCGYGNMLFLYRKENIVAEGIDLDRHQVSLANKIGLPAKTANFFNMEAKDKYDIITSFDFIEHVSKSDAMKAIYKFNELLKSGGTLVLRTPCGDSPFGLRDFAEDPTHKWIGTSTCISSMLKIAGFENIEVLEDWPNLNKFKVIRRIAAIFTRNLFRLLIFSMGLPHPKCLSSSMIIVARKKYI